MQNKKYLIIIGYLFILFVCSFSYVGLRIDNKLVARHQMFIFCKLIKNGMTQEQVEQVLLTVGPYKTKDVSAYQDDIKKNIYQFNDPLLSHITGDYIVMGFQNNMLVTRYRYTSLSDHFYICKEDLEVGKYFFRPNSAVAFDRTTGLVVQLIIQEKSH